MEELLQLREYIQAQKYQEALTLINDMEEMSLEDKLHKIRSYSIILLLHLIKQKAENRTTRSWDVSIKNALAEIRYVNKRRKSKGFYANFDELKQIIEEAYEMALSRAALEAFEGQFSEEELSDKIDRTEIIDLAFQKIISN